MLKGQIIGIDMGHCLRGADTGASKYITEQIENRKVGNEVIRLLREAGNKVINCTLDNSSSLNYSLNYRVNTANNNGVTKFFSIHYNAGGGEGTEVFTWNGNRTIEAVNIKNNLVNLGFKDRGIKNGSHLAVINGTVGEANLIEVCFVDSARDCELYKKIGINAIAMAIAKGIDPEVGKNKPVETPQQVEYKEEDHWGYPYVVKYNKWASEKGIKGISELRLDDNITRAEAIRLLVDTIEALEK